MIDLKHLKGDVFGGLTAGIVALPLALAFGVQSGLGASAGLYGAIALGLIAAIFGGTQTQISGPTGPMTVVSATIVAMGISNFGNLQNAFGIIVLTFFLAGLFQIVFGLLRIGKYVKFIPYPVLSGFMTGIGVIIIIIQLNPLIGIENNASITNVLIELPANLLKLNSDALLIGSLTLLIMLFTPKKLNQLIPAPLIALLVLTPISIYYQMELKTIGEIPIQLPQFIVPMISLEQLKVILTLSLTYRFLLPSPLLRNNISNNANASFYLFVNLYIHFCSKWNKYINPTSKFNKSAIATLYHFCTSFSIIYNSFRQRSGYLPV